MTTSDEFKQQLQAGRIVDALTLALAESVELKITTWVSSAHTEAKHSSNPDEPPASCRMRTRLNIVEGSIDTEVGSQFIGNGPYTELRQFHMDQVQSGRQIIQHNLENLQQIFTVLTHTLAQLPPASRRGTDPLLSPSSQDRLS
ncbi:MAG TPA: hypothetical protein DEG17_11770 [Cyanobacteria bacterium UBA11149]|nr:hypothetical protein [Cyanobacteria bacterium UBA11367]HBE59780.1 hypothetical protein [Cyanobacteria bacterium UBA11366]HBK64266.1 hypothetical protein [Cyanobacteria bacterium UBA11166]HBR72354.1 hypothetical protein [Cyanobacteria bacterium UBA11159]HBS70861.1 hypothetical protein [Cyanobacteria bacterium UBA11153]HBW89523.1 hypothetical protein [Cyanobacteria bacterium UBA11149]HCA94937.1 hypothetical protein [Cyanobacteria bacterium UBA9226]